MMLSQTKHGITVEQYLEQYAALGYEYADGEVIKMSPVTLTHNDIEDYLRSLLITYLSLADLGKVVSAPFTFKLDDSKVHEPDLQVILKTNPGTLTETMMLGAADICVEIVSPESVERDYGTKFQEYEQCGVREYWLIDPTRQLAFFYRLTDAKTYTLAALDTDDHYRSGLLPGLVIHVPTLWCDPLTGIIETVENIRRMVGTSATE